MAKRGAEMSLVIGRCPTIVVTLSDSGRQASVQTDARFERDVVEMGGFINGGLLSVYPDAPPTPNPIVVNNRSATILVLHAVVDSA